MHVNSTITLIRYFTFTFSVAVACSLVVACLLVTGCARHDSPPLPSTQTIILADQTFTLDLALDRYARTRGLSRRDSLPTNAGMLFVFPQSEKRTFWMKDCLIPLDIIFLDQHGTIVSIHRAPIQPPDTYQEDLIRYDSGKPSQFVIELNMGTADKLGLKEGSHIDLPINDLKKRAR